MKQMLNYLAIESNSVGETLKDPDTREQLRRDLKRDIDRINEKLAEGKHITSLDYVVFTEGQGFHLMVKFDQDVVEPGEAPNPLENIE